MKKHDSARERVRAGIKRIKKKSNKYKFDIDSITLYKGETIIAQGLSDLYLFIKEYDKERK